MTDIGAPHLAAATVPYRDRILALKDRLLGDLRPALPEGTPIAMLGYPAHDNVGDVAIWLGQLAIVEALGLDLRFVADEYYVPTGRIRDAIGRDGVVVLSGGGNLGDLWPAPMAARAEVLKACRGQRIVQLPQSICFTQDKNADEMKRMLEDHGDITMFLRDAESMAYCTDVIGFPATFTTDIVFALGPLDRARQPVTDVLYLRREDKESIHWSVPVMPGSSIVGGWPAIGAGEHGPEVKRLSERVRYARRAAKLPVVGHRAEDWRISHFEPLARGVLQGGLEYLAGGRVVVSDRLHAHLLSTLMGVPNVAVDSNNRKVSSFVNAWTGACTNVRMAERAEQVRPMLSELIGA
jgi:exopolysaccharide biosynthesis predicted pyruvyltransferase EpsI